MSNRSRTALISVAVMALAACATVNEPTTPAATPAAAATTPGMPSPPPVAAGAPAATTTAPVIPSASAIANAQRLAGAPGSATAAPPVPAPAPGALRSFADVSKDYKELPGMLPLWQKEDKVLIELAPDQFDRR